ncbi:MAG: VOC family protein [Candidatus Acidiferrales bacterium]
MANPKIQPFLMFEGEAEEAMKFYVSLFIDAQVFETVRYGPKESGIEGSVKRARFSIGSQTILCTDSTVQHAFSFTPAFSFFVECESESEITRLYEALAAGGSAAMPIGNYGFSSKFAWVRTYTST